LRSRTFWREGCAGRQTCSIFPTGSQLYRLHIRVGDGLGLRWGRRIDSKDLADNLTSVREAAAKADLVVFSIHAHEQGRWLTDLAHRIIDAGADVFFAHGPHRMLGIEIYKDKPIFYGLGDFVSS
jgi:Bacterial capsule synthesis protein PGA_cap